MHSKKSRKLRVYEQVRSSARWEENQDAQMALHPLCAFTLFPFSRVEALLVFLNPFPHADFIFLRLNFIPKMFTLFTGCPEGLEPPRSDSVRKTQKLLETFLFKAHHRNI